MAKVMFIGSMAVKLCNSMGSRQSSRFVPSGMRKKIKGFSNSSKRNLLWNLQTVNYEELNAQLWNAYFITLTYQYDFDEPDLYFSHKNLNIAKKDLDKFFKRLKRFFEKLGVDWFCFWKMEFFRKAPVPHFHLMLFVGKHSDISQKSLSVVITDMWVNVITKGLDLSDDLLRKIYAAATNVRYTPMDRYEILQVYISKEIGKEYQVNVDDYTGRFWGIENRNIYKIFKLEDRFLLADKVWYRLRRDLKNYLRSKGYNSRIRGEEGKTGYYLNAKDWERLVNFYSEVYGNV
jgi:hypothetical protein